MARASRHPHGSSSFGAFNAVRTTALGLAKVLSLGISAASAAPLGPLKHNDGDDEDGEGTPTWVLLVASMVLVLLGGAFAGLTIALMGQDGIYLQVLARDETEPQHNSARKVYKLLQRGKHWVLVTLLLSNVIVNETLPVVLDRCLGGGVAAVVGSTFLIVIFGEVVPQSICVRHGLPIGGFMSKPVLLLMWLMAPLAWPTAKLLDYVLGEDHGTVYKKSGLKTLVTLHRSLGEVSERLNQDEVTIISAVLDLKGKPVENVMTPMDDVFVMSEDTVLDEKMMDMILSQGYSRIPIHEPGKPTNFIGMLLVKILITYDPEDAMLVRDFPLATLPETRPETSCLDIVNFFQEGKSHMVLVSEYPGEDHGALGVVTLEDVIEELIGEEIIDESDVYIDVHKAIRRLAPAPHARIQRRQSGPDEAGKSTDAINGTDVENGGPNDQKRSRSAEARALSSSPRTGAYLMRRSSAGLDGAVAPSSGAVPVRTNLDELRQHLRHLGPSNPATNPKGTRSTTVKIKPGIVHSASAIGPQLHRNSVHEAVIFEDTRHDGPNEDEEGDESTSLLRPPITGKDGVQALHQSYGSVRPASPILESPQRPNLTVDVDEPSTTETHDHATQTTKSATATPAAVSSPDSPESGNSDFDAAEIQRSARRLGVRSGSITENVVESRGIRKVVLEAHSSTDDDEVAPPHHHMSGVWSPGGQHARNKSTNSLLSGAGGTVSDVEEENENEHEGDEAGEASEGKNGDGPSTHDHKPGGHHGSSSGGGPGGGVKKKNRRKKRKASKS